LTAKPDREASAVCAIISWDNLLSETMSAAIFRELACGALADIHLRKKKRDRCRWKRTLSEGDYAWVRSSSTADPKLATELSALPLTELAEQLRKLSPELSARTDLRNPRRVVRAIESLCQYGCPEDKYSSRGRCPRAAVSDRGYSFAAFSLLRDRAISTTN